METPKRNALLGDIIDIEAGNIFGLFKEYPSPYSLKDYGDVYYLFKT